MTLMVLPGSGNFKRTFPSNGHLQRAHEFTVRKSQAHRLGRGLKMAEFRHTLSYALNIFNTLDPVLVNTSDLIFNQ